jgi:hypothetical protein
MESRSFKLCRKSDYFLLVSITVLKFISSEVHPPLTASFDVFVAIVDVVIVVVNLSL